MASNIRSTDRKVIAYRGFDPYAGTAAAIADVLHGAAGEAAPYKRPFLKPKINNFDLFG